MGAPLDSLLNFCSMAGTKSRRKSMQTVEIKVKMDCDGCERRVKNAAENLKGVTTVEVDRKQSLLTVTGFVDPNKVLQRVKKTGKRAEFWPYIPYNFLQHSNASQAYDKRVPPGYIKNLQSAPMAISAEETVTFLFSDDNPNACSIM